MWYQDWFQDANYSVVYDHRDDEEAERMMSLIERTTGAESSRSVLDLACGSGRHSIHFARRGYTNVTGIDLSPTLLTVANATAAAEGLDIRFLERDMRDIPVEQFDLIVNLFTSFGYFKDDEDNWSVIDNVGAALREGGWFVLDFLNANHVRSHLIAHDERLLPNGGRLEQIRWIEHGRVEKRLLLRKGEEAQEFVESVRLFELKDFQSAFERAGLTLYHTFGNYTGDEFSPLHSPRLIMFAKR